MEKNSLSGAIPEEESEGREFSHRPPSENLRTQPAGFRNRFSVGVVTVIVVLAGLALICPGIVELWDGGFSQVEFQVTVINQNGRPIEGVTLSVTDHKGDSALGYPVMDFRGGLTPTSDEKGLMVFHHVNLSPEFGGKCRKLFFLIPVGVCEAPKYHLHFLLRDRELACYEYSDYLGRWPLDWKTLPKVKRPWKPMGRSPASLPEYLRLENRSMPPNLEYYVIAQTITINQ